MLFDLNMDYYFVIYLIYLNILLFYGPGNGV